MFNPNRSSFNDPHGESSPVELLAINKKAVALASANRLDEAIQMLDDAVRRYPLHSAAHHNLGAVFAMKSCLEDAAACFSRAIKLNPRADKSHYNLANILKARGDINGAICHLKRVLEINPNHHSAGYILAICANETPDRTPPEFVRQLFDQYSSNFEKVLVEDLAYRTPSLLYSLFEKSAGPPRPLESLLDLGCGTGLGGLEFKKACRNMAGVDISAKMLECCRGKNIY